MCIISTRDGYIKWNPIKRNSILMTVIHISFSKRYVYNLLKIPQHLPANIERNWKYTNICVKKQSTRCNNKII